MFNEKMSSIKFPDPRTHEFTDWVMFGEYYYNASDIIGFGGELTVENLRDAYRKGIFPWPIDGLPLPWFCPEKRAILEFDDLHIPKSLQKFRQKKNWKFTIDKDFAAVIKNCAKMKRPHEAGTWITKDFIETYGEFHRLGEAHSVEVWDEAENLIGGLYGIDANGVFCGESMFYKESNASKLALIFLIDHLRSRGASWLDTQVMTPHFENFGAKEIPREDFLDKLEETQKLNLELF
jgi:leucyl/phenylalanyl-tRNA--protein transferase